MNILNLLANDGFICVNKHIIKQLGLEEAVMIGELASIYTYNYNRDTLLDGWFYATIEKIQENTGLSEYKQQQVITKLCEYGILKQELKGMPRRRYLAFDENILLEMLTNTQFPKIKEQAPENSETSSPKIREQAPENSETIYNNTIYKNKDKNTPQQVGVISNKNNLQILVENNQNQMPKVPRVHAPVVQAGVQLPKKVKAKLLEFDPETKKTLINYCLFLIDSYNFKEAALCNRIDELVKKARGVPKAIEVLCRYNINGGYGKLYIPGNLGKKVAEEVVISQQATEDDFVRDENGNVEEIW